MLPDLAAVEAANPIHCSIATCNNLRRQTNNTTPYCENHRKRWYIFKSRGFSEAKYDELQTVENCDCCGQFLKQRNMDHDHNHCPSGRWCVQCVRGVICSRCNGLLAGLDDIEWRKLAERYLNLYGSREVGEYR